MLGTSSTTLVSMASQLSEAEERERVFSGKGRWNQVRSLNDAKNLMNYLFNLASSSRCLLRDKEVDCREKDMEVRDLKEKVVRLSCSLRQLEMKKAELIHQLKLQSAALNRHSESQGDSGSSDINAGGHKYDLRKPEYRRSTILLEDMDISDASDAESDDYDVDATDEEWVESEKLQVKKRNSRTRRSSMENDQSSINSPEDLKDNSREGVEAALGETASDICCSCSKASSCKTMKCQCRATGNNCGKTCGCLATKCANRASGSHEEPSLVDVVEGMENDFNIEETDHHLTTQGAELLLSALVEKPAETNSNHGPRKPLSDIGNTLAKSNVPKPNQRKKWRKSSILLVSNPPSQPESSEVLVNENNTTSEANASMYVPQNRPENVAVAPKAENNFTETGIPLKIPRAMRKAASSNVGIPLGERNAVKPDESVKKEAEAVYNRSPLRQKRTLEEKENHGH